MRLEYPFRRREWAGSISVMGGEFEIWDMVWDYNGKILWGNPFIEGYDENRMILRYCVFLTEKRVFYEECYNDAVLIL